MRLNTTHAACGLARKWQSLARKRPITQRRGATMQLPDEAISYDYKNLLIPTLEEWTPAAELRQEHFLAPAKLRDLVPRAMQVRSQVATERDLKQVPPEMVPLDAGFIDLPQKLLDQHKRNADTG